MRFFQIIVLLFALPCLAWGQERRHIVVMDTLSAPIRDCNVVAYRVDSTFIRGVVTDSLGSVFIEQNDSISFLRFSHLVYHSKDVSIKELPNCIVLSPLTNNLSEVVIKARHRQTLSLTDGQLRLRVQGTALSEQSSITHLLSHIPGVMVTNEGEVGLFGGGRILILIDGRESMSITDLGMLDPSMIETITLDRNPSSRYKGGIAAVLSIQSKRRPSSHYAQARLWQRVNSAYSHIEDLLWGYNNDKLSFSLQLQNTRERMQRDDVMEVRMLSRFDLNSRLVNKMSTQKNNLLIQTDFVATPSISLGAKYQLSKRDLYSDVQDFSRHRDISGLSEDVRSCTGIDNKVTTHHLSTYLDKRFNPRLVLSFNTDLYIKQLEREQHTAEQTPAVLRMVDQWTNASYLLWQLSPRLSYTIGKKSRLDFGLDLNHIFGEQEQRSSRLLMSGENSERLLATYIDYSFVLGKWQLSLGVRPELAKSKIMDRAIRSAGISRTDNSLFFMSKVAIVLGKSSHQLNISSGTLRPSLEALSNNNYYSNQFISQESNPHLLPQKYYRVGYQLSYTPLYFSLSYQYTNNYIAPYFKPNTRSGLGYIISNENYSSHHRLSLLVNLSKTWNWYTLNLMGMGQIERLSGAKYSLQIKRRPMLYILATQTFAFPNIATIELRYRWQSRLTSGIFEADEEHQLDLELRRSFFNKKLDLSLILQDPFKTSLITGRTAIEGLRIYSQSYRDKRSIALQLRYHFNSVRKKSRANTASSSIQRLSE